MGSDAELAAQRGRGFGMQHVYDTLREEILAGVMEPGSPLDEVRLSERFGMSRTPVREALLKLGADDLVATLPNRNTIVAPIDFRRFPYFFEALTLMYRVTITGAAAARPDEAALAPARAWQRSFVEAAARDDAQGMIATNREFHVAIAAISGNPYYMGFFSKLLDEGRRILRLYYATFDDRLPQDYVEEHEEILAAIAAGDEAWADRMARSHSEQIINQIRNYLSRHLDRARDFDL